MRQQKVMVEKIVACTSPYIPDSPEDILWDVIVIGTGMGGATCGFELAVAGRSVLFVERGFASNVLSVAGERHSARLHEDRLLLNGYWPESFTLDTSNSFHSFNAPIGCGAGGGTALYAGVLDRFFPLDFEPGNWVPRELYAHVPKEWPISYSELAPFYAKAEEMYRVRGTIDPLRNAELFKLIAPPPCTAKESLISQKLVDSGLHPFRLHQANEFADECSKCFGMVCKKACKNDAAKISLKPALENHGAKILPRCNVVKILTEGTKVKAIECEWDGKRLSLHSKQLVVAAGSFSTPRLLLHSKSTKYPNGLANSSGLVGRNLMFHVSEHIILRPKGNQPSPDFRTGISLNDFYVWEGIKLGNFHAHATSIDKEAIQAFLSLRQASTPKLLQRIVNPFSSAISAIASRLFSGAIVFSSIIEDFPFVENRVMEPSQINYRNVMYKYRITNELKSRVEKARSLFINSVKGEFDVVTVQNKLTANISHACGTCRFGSNPNTSVLDRYNRAHNVANLYVVDASFFPTSGGINPSLTIAANALRVASHIANDF